MTEAPIVSAIIPVRNGVGLVAEAVRSARTQTLPVLELIVVDDGSDDGTADAVRAADPDAIVLRQAGHGPAQARNVGAEAASGTFLAFLDHDDLWPPGRNAALLAALQAVPAAELLCGRTEIEQCGQSLSDARLMAASGRHTPFLLSSVLVRAALWRRLGGLDTGHDLAEDTDFYLRACEAGVRPVLVDAVTLQYRQHGANRSRQVAAAQLALLRAMQGSVARSRS